MQIIGRSFDDARVLKVGHAYQTATDYVNAAKAESNAALSEFVDFYLEDESLTALVEEAGYVPLPDDRVQSTRERWDARETGTAVPAG